MIHKHLLVGATLVWAFASICSAQSPSSTAAAATGGSSAPYIEGPVWTVTMVKTKPGMGDDYLKTLSKIYKSTADAAKKAGVITDYKILIGDASNAQDFDILLMQQFKNMAAFDGLRDKLDPIDAKIVGNEETQRQGAIKRMEVREILGDKTMREITLK